MLSLRWEQIFLKKFIKKSFNAKFLEQNPDLAEKVDFEVQLGGSGDGDVADKLRLALTSGENVPDIDA